MLGAGGRMSEAVAARAAGAAIDAYLLGGYRVDAIRPPGRLHVLNMAAAASYGRLQATFQLLLPGSAAELAAQGLRVLAAAADLDTDLNLIPHSAAQARAARACCRTGRQCDRGCAGADAGLKVCANWRDGGGKDPTVVSPGYLPAQCVPDAQPGRCG